jgi:hypothetical protein
MRIALRDRLEDRLLEGELGFSVVFGESHRHQRFVAGPALFISQAKVKTSRSGSTISR